MTFSIVARCKETGEVGVAAATAMPAVGKLVTHAYPRVGAIATQARLNPYLGLDGLRLLQEGRSAPDVLERLKHQDPRIDLRQFAVVDRVGAVAAWTGKECPEWAGHEEHDGFSVQGNRLAGSHVLEEVAKAFNATQGQPLADRFLAALAAGDAVGGDTKGELSATIYVMDTEEYPLWDIRVDEHKDPVGELRRLHHIFAQQLLPQIKKLPTRANPAGEIGEENA